MNKRKVMNEFRTQVDEVSYELKGISLLLQRQDEDAESLLDSKDGWYGVGLILDRLAEQLRDAIEKVEKRKAG